MDDPEARAPVLAGKYVLGELIGTGGMGMVYRATQPALRRSVAVKVMRPDLIDDPRMVRHFQREALAAARVSHRGLVAIFDAGTTDDGRPFLAMEYVPGRLLGRLISEELPPLRRAHDIVMQILAALAEVHRAGIVHADLKSDNVMVETTRTGDTWVRVLDFGLAHIAPLADQSSDDPLFQDDLQVDRDGQRYISGTPEYMAPEVVVGGAATAASDLYSVGILLYELLTGTTPFGGGPAIVVIHRHLTDPVEPPSRRRPGRDIPAAVEAVVERALAKEPVDRFADAEAFAAALAAAMPVAAAGSSPQALPVAAVPPRPGAGGSHGPHVDDHEDRLRCAIADALVAGRVEDLVLRYLELARALVARGDRHAATRELVEAVDIVTGGGGVTAIPEHGAATLLLEMLAELRPRGAARHPPATHHPR